MSEKSGTKRLPLSLYRVQLGRHFDFAACEQRLAYLESLGVTTLYLSPIMQARKESLHGYDVVSYGRISRESGGEAGFERLTKALDDSHPQMGLVLDIVPNHMSFSFENEWIHDVLLHGPCSRYAPAFDINWESRVARRHSLALPILAETYLEAVSRRHLRVEFSRSDMRLIICYFDHKFPVCPKSLRHLFAYGQERLTGTEYDRPEIRSALEALTQAASALPRASEIERAAERLEATRLFARQFKMHLLKTGRFARALEHFTQALAVDGALETEVLHKIIYRQTYQFFYWKTGLRRRNYRTFFDIAELIATNPAHPDTFELIHAAPVSLFKRKSVIGMRVDHLDGIRDPGAYLEKLNGYIRSRTNRHRHYLWVEKVLHDHEQLARGWEVAGTTGYDFLSRMARFFCVPGGVVELRRLYGNGVDGAAEVLRCKDLILESVFPSVFDKLCADLKLLLCTEPMLQDFSAEAVRAGMRAFVLHCDRSRFYLSNLESDAQEQISALAVLIEKITGKSDNTASSDSGGRAASGATQTHADPVDTEAERNMFLRQFGKRVEEILRRFAAGKNVDSQWKTWFEDLQVLLVPVGAKGVEDTYLYRDTACVNFCEVGTTPLSGRIGIKDLHEFFKTRSVQSPCSVNSTSTHDTKRSEDVRSRLAVLTECVNAWKKLVDTCNELNRNHIEEPVREVFQQRYDHFFYQSLYGIYWPQIPKQTLADRMVKYFRKALREEKILTNWYAPVTSVERPFLLSIERIVLQEEESPFYRELNAFHSTYSVFGALNGLSQTILKCTAPGIPDIYQGCEVWNHCLVDPDNRQNIEFDGLVKRMSSLESERKGPVGPEAVLKLLESWEDGRIKMFVLMRLLHLRRAHPQLFLEGDYLPLECVGSHSGHVFAFMRRHQRKRLIVITTRGLLSAFKGRRPKSGKDWDWQGHVLQLGKSQTGAWRDVFTGDTYADVGDTLHLAIVLQKLPFACLESR